MISIRNMLIVFVIGTAAIGLGLSPSVSYGQTSSNSSAVMNTTSAIRLLPHVCGFSPLGVLTITPVPVKGGTNFTVSGKLVDLFTGQGIGNALVGFHAVAVPGGSISIPSVHTSNLSLPTFSRGTFHSSATAPHRAAVMAVIATAHPTGYLECVPSLAAGDVVIP
jgi:hypothetical protein